MNDNYRRVPTQFGPETGFAVKPSVLAPGRARQAAEFERLKAELLAERLDPRNPQLEPQLRRVANEAAALAWVTEYPLLVYPALFAEQAEAALLRAVRQEQVRERSRELLVA